MVINDLFKIMIQLHADGSDGTDGSDGSAAPNGGVEGGTEPTGTEPTGTEPTEPSGTEPSNTDDGKKQEESPRFDMFADNGEDADDGKNDDATDGDSNTGIDNEDVVPYEFNNLPDGYEVPENIGNDFNKVAREMNLDQSQVDKLVAMHVESMQQNVAKQDKILDGWAKESKEKGLTTKEGFADARRTINTFGGSEFQDVLVQSGLQYNPAVQGFLQKIGNLLREDGGTGGGKQPTKEPSIEEMFFYNSKPKR